MNSLEKKSKKAATQDGNFTVRGGIAYCNTCGKPRQTMIDMGEGNRKLVWCACTCLNDAGMTDAAKERIEKLQQRGNVSPKCTFYGAESSYGVGKCKKYADNWEEANNAGAGLVLWGSVGTGKTFAAHCIANELIKHDIPVYITSLSRVINAGFDKADALKRIRETPLVVFDDLGAERSSEYALEMVYLLVDERYRTGKPLIVTTNLAEKELRNPQDLDRKRIYDRILERCVPIHFDGGSKREEEAAKMLEFMRELLSD